MPAAFKTPYLVVDLDRTLVDSRPRDHKLPFLPGKAVAYNGTEGVCVDCNIQSAEKSTVKVRWQTPGRNIFHEKWHFIETLSSRGVLDFTEWSSGCSEDEVIPLTGLLVGLVMTLPVIHVAYITARGAEAREPTLRWLKDHKLFRDGIDVLVTRKDGQLDPVHEYKVHEVEKIRKSGGNIIGAIDDSPQVISAYKMRKIPVLKADLL